jgi:hypothetical protein
MEFEGIYAYHEPGCFLEICQWWGGPCFEGAEISLDVYLPHNQVEEDEISRLCSTYGEEEERV